MNDQDKDYSNLFVKGILAVPGRAVIRELVVNSLIVANEQKAGNSGNGFQALTASAPPSQQPLLLQFAGPSSLYPPSFFAVQTTCVIPLAVAGTGSWLNLKECAFFESIIRTRSAHSNIMTSLDQTNLIIVELGLYRIDCNLRIGHCGYGTHCFSIGLGLNSDLPLRPVSACQSLGSTLDLTGNAVGVTLVEIEHPNTIIQIYLRDDSQPATDANIFTGTLLFTKVG